MELLWLDLEMTGLNEKQDAIIEIACILTNADLNVSAVMPSLVVSPPDSAWTSMTEFAVDLHKSSGLFEMVENSNLLIDEAEDEVVAWINEHRAHKDPLILAGNSISTDRMFIKAHMPKLNALLHYRQVDVTSIKLLAEQWYSELPGFTKTNTHRALDDIKESIAELAYYKKQCFKS